VSKTYDHGASVHEVAGRVLTILLDHGIVTGAVQEGRWRPASVILAGMVFPDQPIDTRAAGDGPAYTRYYKVMAALDLLFTEGIIVLGVEPSGELWRVGLA
jgi:hypothetical protein